MRKRIPITDKSGMRIEPADYEKMLLFGVETAEDCSLTKDLTTGGISIEDPDNKDGNIGLGFKVPDGILIDIDENNKTIYFIEFKDFMPKTGIDKKGKLFKTQKESPEQKKWIFESFKKSLDCFLLYMALKKPTDFIKSDLKIYQPHINI